MLTIKHVSFDANYLPNLGVFGSSAGSGCGCNLFECVCFYQTAFDAVAVGSPRKLGPGSGGAGMLVGSTFNRCSWYGCFCQLLIDINDDDILFQGCRFMCGKPNA